MLRKEDKPPEDCSPDDYFTEDISIRQFTDELRKLDEEQRQKLIDFTNSLMNHKPQ